MPMSSTAQMASLAVLIISLVFAALASDAAAGVRVELTRVHADPSVTASQFVRGALRRDMHRHNARKLALAASSGGTVSAPTQDSPTAGEYLMALAIGTPPLPYQAIADTGSDLIWTQCAPCTSQCFRQPTPLYNPSSSTTFAVLPCNSSLSVCAAALAGTGTAPPPGCACTYNVTYGSGWTSVFQGSETFTFGSTPAGHARVPGIAFGCSTASSGFNASSASGLVGLGRGRLSLVSQLGVPKFSYCLTPYQDTNSTSTLLLGPSASLNGTAGVSSTPFVASPSTAPMNTFYYLNLTGISLGTTALSIPPDAFSLNADGTGGLIIDSGTTITLLGNTAYQQVRAAVVSLVTLPTTDGSADTGLDLCFMLPSSTSAPPAMPSMTLHFNGADMVLPADSYMMSDDSGLWCLAMQNQTDGEVNILGNYQQQNMHILYDIGQETLSFAPAKCSAL
ncbi:Aspartic proteinase nepenthesin-1 [Zea mays]|uniref:Aspartic proteinase nepenthesin-1 n=1 Tax=Zea mays TaxID=4577 RepID=A0A3L6DWF8_MAIZE|nr:Aspartic proteinase nepenthesin-1 [Zea mays]